MTLTELLKKIVGLIDSWAKGAKTVPKKVLALRRVIQTLSTETKQGKENEEDSTPNYKYPKEKAALDKSWFSKSYVVKDLVPEIEEYLSTLYSIDAVELGVWRDLAGLDAKDFSKIEGNKIPEASYKIKSLSDVEEKEIMKSAGIKGRVLDSEFEKSYDEKEKDLIKDAGIKVSREKKA